MNIRKIMLVIIIGLVFLLFGAFLSYTSSPFKEDVINDVIIKNQITEDTVNLLEDYIQDQITKGLIFDIVSRNFYLVWGLIGVGVVFIIAGVHMFIDKLFFKKFYEPPYIIPAFRRAILFVIAVSITFVAKFINLQGVELGVILLSLLLIEAVFVYEALRRTKKRGISGGPGASLASSNLPQKGL